MLPVIAKWTILKGCNEEAVVALRELAAEVQEKSPFVLLYTIHVPNFEVTSFPTPPEQEVVFFSVFTDQAGFMSHMKSPVFNTWMAKYSHLFLTKNGDLFVVSEFLTRKAGFIRSEMMERISAEAFA